MITCVFVGNLAMLVNRCSTQEINTQMGLKKWDPLASLLLVVEGLSDLVNIDDEISLY